MGLASLLSESKRKIVSVRILRTKRKGETCRDNKEGKAEGKEREGRKKKSKEEERTEEKK
jgi:hypothetical protein